MLNSIFVAYSKTGAPIFFIPFLKHKFLRSHWHTAPTQTYKVVFVRVGTCSVLSCDVLLNNYFSTYGVKYF